MLKELERREQKVLFSDFEYFDGQEAKAYLVIKENKELLKKGPPKENKEAVKRFRQGRKIFFRKGYAYAKQKISLEEIFDFLKRFEQEMSVGFEVV